MKNFKLKPNQRLGIIVGEIIYRTLIIDIDEDYIKINLPVINGEYLFLYANDIVDITVCLEKEKCFDFNAKVISKGKEGNIVYYKLSSPFNIRRIQRREFFRVGVLQEINYKNITDINKEKIEEIEYKECTLVDLSASGAKIKLFEKDIKLGDIVDVKIFVDGKEEELKGQVMRILDESNGNNRIRTCGIKFLELTQVQIDQIIKYLFDITRKKIALR